MSDDFVLNAQLRDDQGKGASRRLRRNENLVPAVVYGSNKKPTSIQIPHKDLVKQLENEAFYSHIVTLNIGDKSEDVILKDLQRHPAKALILHADFLRVSKTKKLQTKAPLHFINEETCVGVKAGGIVVRTLNELDIVCLPGDLPEFIEVDLANVEVGQSIHISELTLPKGVESVALSHGEEQDLTVASIAVPRGAVEAEEESTEEGSEEQGDSED